MQTELKNSENNNNKLINENNKLMELVDSYKSELLMYGHEFDDDDEGGGGVDKQLSPRIVPEINHK